MQTNESLQPELKAKQALALVALLNEPTLEKAAEKAGVVESTLIRWLKEPEFAKAYREAKWELVNHSVAKLQAASSVAVDTLISIANDFAAPYPSRVAASRIIIESALKGTDSENLVARLERLEELAKGGGLDAG